VSEELKRDYREDLALFEGPRERALAVLFVASVLAYACFAASSFVLYIMTTLTLFVVAAYGLNLLVGYAGQISLGQAAFLAIGAYTHVILYTQGAPLLI
jgi:branched-chain amino acid transport system permease protein